MSYEIQDVDFNVFLDAFVECLLWSETDESGEPMDVFSWDDLDKAAQREILADCLGFWEANEALICEDPSQAGHDFALTRNGHGAGFWDGDWPEPAATALTEASEAYGPLGLMLCEDSQTIYHHN